MTNSATSTEARRPAGGSGFHAWHFFTLLSMLAATAVVVVSPDTHPVALLLLSAAVICAGFVGVAITRAVSGFFAAGIEAESLPPQMRDELLREKTLVLRSIKELEFDKAMKKVSDEDFAAISAQLRARALTLMADLERTAPAVVPKPAGATAAAGACLSCGTRNDADARFCKSCGARLAGGG
jgi:hypothetical protein